MDAAKEYITCLEKQTSAQIAEAWAAASAALDEVARLKQLLAEGDGNADTAAGRAAQVVEARPLLDDRQAQQLADAELQVPVVKQH